MNELTTITARDGLYTITTGYGLVLARDVDYTDALAALYHRGLTPTDAVAGLKVATDDKHVTIQGLAA